MSLKKKLLFSAVTVVAFFLLAEGVLALLGVTPLTKTEDPFVGFSSKIPLLLPGQDDSGMPVLKTAPAKLVWFNDQEFAAKKPANTKRIFCVGGSTTYGRPYWDTTSYSGWLRELLPGVDGETNWEVINAGGVSYASYRVAAVMEELSRYDPDLFIVYSVHNEFLEHRTYADIIEQPKRAVDIAATLASTRTWSALNRLFHRPPRRTSKDILPAEVDEMLNHTIGPSAYHRDEHWKTKILQHYRFNLTRMIDIAKQSGAAVVLITPASNEKDCSPFKSEFGDSLSEDQQDEFARRFERGLGQAKAGDHTSALATLARAGEIDDAHAGLHFHTAKSLFALQRYDQAREAFRRALNEDICPLRAIDEVTLTVESVAEELDVPIVDFQRRLRADCRAEYGHGIFGDEYFLDHVHPRIAVHRKMAVWIIDELLEHAMIGGRPPNNESIAAVERRIRSRVDPQASGVALRNLAKVLHWSGKYDEAMPRALEALDRLPNDPESSLIVADCLAETGDIEQALARYDHLLEVHPLYLRAMLRFAEVLVDQQDFQRAKPLLESTFLLMEPGDAQYTRAQYYLGIAHVGLGEFKQAIPLLQVVHDRHPDEPRTLFYLAESKAAVGDNQQAIQLYRNALALEPDNAATHQRLGLILLKERQANAAVEHFQAALALDPDNEQLRQHLNIARQLSQ